MLADKIKQIGFSSTFRINTKARQMKNEGIDVINFSVGEPDFPTPENIKNAAKAALNLNYTRYTASSGISKLREAIVKKFSDEYGAEYAPENVIVSTGAKQSLYNACVALLNKGDEIIIPVPYWVSYPEMVKLADGVPVFVEMKEEDGFRLTPENLSRVISSRTKAIILNNPSNPTGAAYDADRLRKIIDICLDEDVFIIADEIYEKLVYNGFNWVSVASMGSKARNQALIINGFSKAYAMTGWRLGYGVGPVDIIQAMGKIQSHSTANTSSISQWAGVEALLGSQNEISRMRTEFERRRNYLMYRLGQIPHCSCNNPEGAFYAFANLSWYYDKQSDGVEIRNSSGLAYYLLKKAQVALVPGDAFGADNFIRLSYSTSMENLEKAMDRISSALAELQPIVKDRKFSLRNVNTRVKKSVERQAISVPERDKLVKEAESILSYDNYYEWNISVGGVSLKLITNSSHLMDFWMENWYPAPLESDIDPHGIFYGIKDAPGRSPRAFYNLESRTGFLFNSAYYPQLRSMVFGMVDDIASKMFDTLMIGGSCVEINGKGVVIMGPPGSGTTTHFTGLLRHPESKIHSHKGFYVRWSGGVPIADSVERKLLMKTNITKHLPELTALFDRSNLENVNTPGDYSDCPKGDKCPLNRGEQRCYEHSSHSRVLLDPYWIGGTAKHVKRTVLHKIILLHHDSFSPISQKLSTEKALKIIEDGAYNAQRGGWRSLPFYNKYLLDSPSKRDHLRRQWTKLLNSVEFSLVNTEKTNSKETQNEIIRILDV